MSVASFGKICQDHYERQRKGGCRCCGSSQEEVLETRILVKSLKRRLKAMKFSDEKKEGVGMRKNSCSIQNLLQMSKLE